MGSLRRLADSSSSFNDLYLIPMIIGGLLCVALLYWIITRRRRRNPHNNSDTNGVEVFDTPPLIEGQNASPSPNSVAVTSPMDPNASFASFKDAEPTKNVWLSGSGRTVTSVKSGSSSSGINAPEFMLETTQQDELFGILHHDAALATRRLAVDKIAFERVLTENSTRQLSLCQFEGEEIVVKRLTPPTHADEVFPALLTFVHEIQLAASLEHPNIARFLGVAWGTKLRLLCYVSEFLPRGDLASFLRRIRKRRLQQSSSTISVASGDSSSVVKGSQLSPPSLQSSGSGFLLTSWLEDKVPLAIGVARALVYLHSRRPIPIIYRVIRARKVELSDRYEPKLTDLAPAVGGAPPPDQEALAAGIGDAFWTAPELLSGGPATEASDIYAFGVLMAEIDSEAKRPYYNAQDTRSGEKLRAFQVLNLVASGQLRPHFAPSCPPEIRGLALACLQQNPTHRPTARDVLRSLQSSVQ
ncbi:hypothetical protein PHYBOEH_010546 [Phytophthora boehmeriae]|uniref:Protein kinase domain-containing protein n=1 Tax=Phytophthora boehmeriae TaxID=109152 RepID=A0A8T1VQ13_9STRA|nr:hypothetical protein PHYBOEH_010546 [Phytophthora boehmeriae]